MIRILFIFCMFICSSSCDKKDMPPVNPTNMDSIPSPANSRKYYYLALGDSYTIGESVPIGENFPNQSAFYFKTDSFYLDTRIIARTGWTTEELEAGIVAADANSPLRTEYDYVSLLIGVNNQYRGRTVDSYRPEFENLLKKAIRYAGNRPSRVVVLSIPDWGVTPFASGLDRTRIAGEIDAYNAANKSISQLYNVQYIDITPWTREAASDPTLLAPDGLHPSGKEYRRWAERVANWMRAVR